MTKKLNKAAAILLTAAAALCLASCGDEPQRLDQSQAQPTAGNSVTVSTESASGEASVITGQYPAPGFRSGVYHMVSTNVNEQTASSGGAVYYAQKSTLTYEYDLNLSVSAEGAVCAYTFTRVSWSDSVNGEVSGVLDTDNPAGRSDASEMYYELVGQTFYITTDRYYNVTGISGVAEIIAAHPAVYQLINEQSLLALGGDLFYPLPETISAGTSWGLVQNGMQNTYTMTKMRGDMLGAVISGGGIALPEPTYDSSSGITLAYTSAEPLSGTLWMSSGDRCVQELSSYQRSAGTLTGPDLAADISVTVASTCKITAK